MPNYYYFHGDSIQWDTLRARVCIQMFVLIYKHKDNGYGEKPLSADDLINPYSSLIDNR